MSIAQLLLKLFFPSWNFFDRFESYFELEYFDQNEWRKVDFFSHRKLSTVLFNPQGNYELFLRSQLERFVDRLMVFEAAPDLGAIRRLSSYQILQSYLKALSETSAAQNFPLRIFQCRAEQERKLVIEVAGGE